MVVTADGKQLVQIYLHAQFHNSILQYDAVGIKKIIHEHDLKKIRIIVSLPFLLKQYFLSMWDPSMNEL